MRGVTPRSTKHEAPARITALHVIGAFWVVVAVLILGAYFLAPRKPEAPPPSSIAYEKHSGKALEFSGSSDDGWGRRGRRGRSESTTLPQSVAVPSEAVQAISSKFRIYGIVKDTKTGQPLSRARVAYQREISQAEGEEWNRLRSEATQGGDTTSQEALSALGESLQEKGSVQADDQGRYAVGISNAGPYTVNAYCSGYLPESKNRVAVRDDRREVQQDFELSRGAIISGHILERGSKTGAVQVPVYTEGPNSSGHVVSGEDGAYTITGLMPGEHKISLDLRDSPYQTVGGVPSKNVTIVSPDEEVDQVDFVVEPAGIVWGYVLGPDKQPVTRAESILCSSESIVTQAIQAAVKRAPPIHCSTRADGYYELIGVPLNQEWRVYTQAKEFAPQLSDPFLLTDSQRNAHIDIFVMSGSDIFGRVVSTDGTPIPGADVLCIPGYTRFLSPVDSPAAFGENHTKEDGSFEFTNLPVGEYQILATKPKFKFAATGEPIYPDGIRPIRNVQVVLTPVATGEYTVYGTVTTAGGAPIPDVHLGLGQVGIEDMGIEGQDTRSDAQGQYMFTGVSAGFFMLTAEKDGYTPKVVDKVQLDGPTDIVLESGAMVSGRVLVLETGTPPSSYQVRATPALDSENGAVGLMAMVDGHGQSFSNPDGSYALALPSGRYTLTATAPGLTPGKRDIQVAQGDRLDGADLYVSQSGGRIEGRVELADGKSPNGAVVSIVNDGLLGMLPSDLGDQLQRNIQVGDDGAFAFERLPEGTYVVQAQMADYAQGRSDPVTLPAGRAVSGVRVRLGSGGSLQGYVAIEGEMKPGAIVTVVGNGFTKMATTDRNGQYVIEGIPAGRYLASAVLIEGASLSGQFSALHAQVDIADESRTTYNFGEELGARIAGTCVPPPGSGMVGVALLRIPGAVPGLTGLAFGNPAAWFEGNSGAANSILGVSKVGADGYFTIENAPQGTFELDVFYVNLGQLLSGGGRPVYSGAITIGTEPEVTVTIEVRE